MIDKSLPLSIRRVGVLTTAVTGRDAAPFTGGLIGDAPNNIICHHTSYSTGCACLFPGTPADACIIGNQGVGYTCLILSQGGPDATSPPLALSMFSLSLE